MSLKSEISPQSLLLWDSLSLLTELVVLEGSIDGTLDIFIGDIFDQTDASLDPALNTLILACTLLILTSESLAYIVDGIQETGTSWIRLNLLLECSE